MSVKLKDGKTTVTVTNAYAPQVGCEEGEKYKFWQQLGDVLNDVGLAKDEKVIIGADFNGHVGRDRTGFERQHG